jgi:hypothetical protein
VLQVAFSAGLEPLKPAWAEVAVEAVAMKMENKPDAQVLVEH